MASGSIHRCDLHLIMVVTVTVLRTCAPCPSVCNCTGTFYGNAYCNHKNLDRVPAGISTNTRFLRLEYNRLTRLPAGAFSGLSQLLRLTLYNNLITEIEDGTFSGLVALKKLHLGSNNINLLTNNTFQGVPNLEELSLSNNRLLSLGNGVFNQIPNLLELDVSHNGIREFPTEVSKYLSNVQVLDLSSNPAQLLLIQNTVGIFKQIVALQYLKLNKLSEVSNTAGEIRIPESTFDGLPNLTNLELNGNRLSKIPSAIKSLKNLKYISLHMNSIQSVGADDFHQPSLLEILLLDKNKLVEIPASALAQLPHLTKLYLDFNPISTIPARAFWHNPRLTNLSLAYTNLTTIQEDAFSGLDQLGSLNLQGNNLTTIKGGVMTHVNPKVS
ncbi:insulin-like growth factor-binding protein complex acid labile subunit [Acanthaster planci]|uniref:Insulin-like growth factor-binding protein complex acid labile subunit n=1 Tax=Acanthaster planci TaxID=133434 RepID=A0A8B8A6U8_ACAPL|nr:insulin-like growth factor-binding protein complex acid labile subunit [Acanthaster planci]